MLFRLMQSLKDPSSIEMHDDGITILLSFVQPRNAFFSINKRFVFGPNSTTSSDSKCENASFVI